MKTKFLTLLAIPVIGLSSLASGQTEADITTSASVVGPNLWSISQTGTANISGTGDVNFTFDRFESVANGLLAGQTLQAVIVRITHSWGSTSVFVTNDGTENYVGGANERARITFAFDTFTLGARTGQDAEFAAISAGDFTVDSPVVNLPIAGQTITPGQTITANNPGGERTVERNVAEGFFVDYSSTGQFSFSFDSEFDFSSNIAGENMDFGGTFTNSIMEVTIEYVAIPEPGTIAAGLLSLGFIGFTVFSPGTSAEEGLINQVFIVKGVSSETPFLLAENFMLSFGKGKISLVVLNSWRELECSGWNPKPPGIMTARFRSWFYVFD